MESTLDSEADTLKSLRTSIEAIQDRLEIYNLIAMHPPTVDSQSFVRMRQMFTEQGVMDRGEFGSMMARDMPEDNPLMNEAARQGLAHLATFPYLQLSGDSAVAVSYVAAIVSEPYGDPIEVAAHGSGRGHRIYRLTANRWDLVRSPNGWKIERRTARLMDGSKTAGELLHEALEVT